MKIFAFLYLLLFELLPSVILGEEIDVLRTRGEEIDVLRTRGGKGATDGRSGKGGRRRRRGRSGQSFGPAPPAPPAPPGGEGETRRRRRRRRRTNSATSRRRRRGSRSRSGSRPTPTPSKPAPAPPGCRCDRKVCTVHGDPHFITFDGTMMTLVGTKGRETRYWVVKSDRVKIQGLAHTTNAWFTGVAITGSFLKNHVLVGYVRPGGRGNLGKQTVVTWDGKTILEADGAIKPTSGVELMRTNGFDEMKNSGLNTAIQNSRSKCKEKSNCDRLDFETFKKDIVYHFKLPGNVEVLTVLTWPRTVLFIKMPPQRGQGGWCGNFDGKQDDEAESWQIIKLKSENTVKPEDDLFLKAGLALDWAGLQIQSDSAAEEIPASFQVCGTLDRLEQAKSACGHLLQAQILEACIMDVCQTGETEAAVQDAEEATVMRALARGGKGAASVREGGCVCD